MTAQSTTLKNCHTFQWHGSVSDLKKKSKFSAMILWNDTSHYKITFFPVSVIKLWSDFGTWVGPMTFQHPLMTLNISDLALLYTAHLFWKVLCQYLLETKYLWQNLRLLLFSHASKLLMFLPFYLTPKKKKKKQKKKQKLLNNTEMLSLIIHKLKLYNNQTLSFTKQNHTISY